MTQQAKTEARRFVQDEAMPALWDAAADCVVLLARLRVDAVDCCRGTDLLTKVKAVQFGPFLVRTWPGGHFGVRLWLPFVTLMADNCTNRGCRIVNRNAAGFWGAGGGGWFSLFGFDIGWMWMLGREL